MSTLDIAQATGLADRMCAFTQTCLDEHDLNGWLAPNPINPEDVSRLPKR